MTIGLPIRLGPEDFAIERTEHLTTASTVLADRPLPVDAAAGQLPRREEGGDRPAGAHRGPVPEGLSRASSVSRPRPRDPAQEFPAVSWDYVYGTNMQHALLLARRQLSRRHGSKQIVMITDGEPTAHIEADGGVFFNYPPACPTVDATLLEVLRCSKEGIRINTFALDATGHLRELRREDDPTQPGQSLLHDPRHPRRLRPGRLHREPAAVGKKALTRGLTHFPRPRGDDFGSANSLSRRFFS